MDKINAKNKQFKHTYGSSGHSQGSGSGGFLSGHGKQHHKEYGVYED